MVPCPRADGGLRGLQSDCEGHAEDPGDPEDGAEVRGGEKGQKQAAWIPIQTVSAPAISDTTELFSEDTFRKFPEVYWCSVCCLVCLCSESS